MLVIERPKVWVFVSTTPGVIAVRAPISLAPIWSIVLPSNAVMLIGTLDTS